jgi:hypothetical protein
VAIGWMTSNPTLRNIPGKGIRTITSLPDLVASFVELIESKTSNITPIVRAHRLVV